MKTKVPAAVCSGWMRKSVAVVGVLLAGVCGVVAAQAQEGERGFSAAERRALVAGELVRRPRTRVEGPFHYLGGTSFIRVRGSRDAVFGQVLDTEVYPRLIPSVVEARLVEDRGDRRVVYLRHEFSFVSAEYHANVRIERDAHTVHFDLDPNRPHDVRAGRGFITVDPYRGDESIVTWGVLADPGSSILSGLFGTVIRDWILKVPWCIRGHVEPGQPGC